MEIHKVKPKAYYMPMATLFTVYRFTVYQLAMKLDSVCDIVIFASCGNGLTGFAEILVISFGFQILMGMHDQPIKLGVIICYIIT